MAMEQYGNKITVSLNVGDTFPALSADTWRTRARTGDYFVSRSTATADLPTANNALITATSVGADSNDILGLLIAVDGDDSDLVGTVLLQASDVTVRGAGSASTNIPTNQADVNSGVKGSASTGTVAPTAAGDTDGFGQILGGNLARIRMAFSSNILRGIDT